MRGTSTALNCIPAETPDHTAARSFGASVRPRGAHEEAGTSFRDAWRGAASLGLLELLIPDSGADVEKVLASLEGLAQGCVNSGFVLALCAHCCGVGAPLVRFGGEYHRTYVDALRNGTAVAALAATESDAGSDVMALTTRFDPIGDSYILNGAKCFVTNVHEADVFLVLATRDSRLHSRGVSAFLVPADAPGLLRHVDGPRPDLPGCSIGSLQLNQVEVPTSAIVGTVDRGAAIFQHAMLWERSLIGAAHVGNLRRQLMSCLDRVSTRYQFQRPIGSNQYVAGRIVDLLARYRTSRLLVRDTVSRLAEGTLTAGEASLTKLYVSEAQLASTLDTFRINGGSGLLEDSVVSADVRASLAGITYSGTSDIQRVIVASELGLVT